MRLGTVNSSAFRDRGAPIRNATNQAEGIHCISSGCTWIAPLSRMEVITGIGECERAGMRPVVISTKRKVNNQLIPSVVDVTCLPKL